jgi:predicted dehydrogenase
MKPVPVACVGSNGHQIVGLLKGLVSARLTGVAEMDPVRRKALEDAHPDVLTGVPRFATLAEVLQKTECDLVSLCSARRDRQAEQIMACLEAGRHVLAEKPLCTTLEDLERIRAVAKKAGRKVWAMLTMLNMPVLAEFGRIVRSGELGEIGQVYAQKSYKFGGKRPQDRGVDGGITQASIHAISFVRGTTGLEFTGISAHEGSVGNPERGQLQVEFAITARLSNGALCQITANYLNPKCASWWGNDQLRIFGTRGMIEAVDGFTRQGYYLEGGVRREERAPEYPNYLPALLEEIADGKPAPLSMEDSFRCTQIAIEAQLSASAGGAVRKLPWSAAA